MSARRLALLALLISSAAVARAEAALFLEEPFGKFGGFNPTGHAAVYLSRVCAETPVRLRRCMPDEQGVVISRYHRISGYDWIAIPLLPYLYAVQYADQIPPSADEELVASLRDSYRRDHLSGIVPDDGNGSAPRGEWMELVGSAYDRTIYSFTIDTTEEQDDDLIQVLNAHENSARFNLLFRNCANFAQWVLNFYYSGAIRRGVWSDLGIMTPKQAAKSLAKYSERHAEIAFSSLVIPQVPGSLPRSKPVRGVMESFVKSKRYMVPVAALHPFFVGGLVGVYLTQSMFSKHPHLAAARASPVKPQEIAVMLAMAAMPAEPAQ